MLHVRAIDRGVEQQLQVRLPPAEVIQYKIQHRRGALRVRHRQRQPDLLHDPTFTQLRLECHTTAQPCRPHDVHAHLTRSIAAQHGAVLTQNHLSLQSRRRHRAAHARHAATRNQEFRLKPNDRIQILCHNSEDVSVPALD